MDRLLSQCVRGYAARATLLVALFLATFLIGAGTDVKDANAQGWACEPPANSGGGPCIAHSYETGIVAQFGSGGFPVAAAWNFDSQVWFYGFPQNQHAVEVIQLQHAVWTSSTWPSGTWSAGQNTWVEGYVINSWNCSSSPCTLISMPLGSNYRSGGQFDYQNIFSNVMVVSDFGSKARESAWLVPSGGYTYALNYYRNHCKTPSAAGVGNC